MRTHQASRTAVKVGRIMAFLARQPRLAPLLPKGAAESIERLMLHIGLLKPWMLRVFAAPWYSRLMTSIERHTIPGQSLCVGLRKRFMDDETRAALAEGKQQVLVVGGGLDTLSWRLAPEYPEVTFIELDHPATQELKREALKGMGPQPANLHLVSVDLARTPLEECLAQLAVWRKDVPSVVIVEAVLMYLQEVHVSAFLEALHRCTGPGSRLLCTCVCWEVPGRGAVSKSMRRLVETSLRLIGEPFLWTLREGELGPFLARHGFRQDASPERVELHRRYLVPAGLPEVPVSTYEFPVVADRE